MLTNRLIRCGAVALAIAAAAAPAASARPLEDPAPAKEWTLPPDFRSADGHEAATPQRQDLRSADTRDYADGRGTYNAPEVVVVDAPAPAAQPTSGGIDWQDVGLGAGSLLAIALMGAGGALLVAHRRSAGGVAA
jgi:hypothetical protein